MTNSAGRIATRRAAFSLVELLTVIFIISLLIAILIPSLGAARTQAKKVQSQNDIRAIEAALELFRNDHEREFPHSNGYPPAGAHPRIRGVDGVDTFDPVKREFPFLAGGKNPVVTGAHWLPAILLGVDGLGFIPRDNVPSDQRNRPDRWYQSPGGRETGEEMIPRAGQYLEPGALKAVGTQSIRGRPSDEELFGGASSWSDIQNLPVFVDRFEQPILYYAANKHGRTSNMVGRERMPDNRYTGGVQQVGPPYYFHADNEAFTGSDDNRRGWDLGGGAEHPIGFSGAEQPPEAMVRSIPDPEDDDINSGESFARYILDRGILKRFQEEEPEVDAPMKPVNDDSYLLISAGSDGLYGTPDDVTNFPLRTE